MSTRILWLLPVLLLAACQAGVTLYSRDSSGHQVTAVKLLQPLTIAPDTTRVFIQDGQVLPRARKGGSYRTQCAFEVQDRQTTQQIIRPGSFRVTRQQGLMDEVVQSKPLLLAGFRLAGMDDGGAPMVHLGYHFWFEPNQSNVRRMTCYGVLADMSEVEEPILEEIRRALDGVAELIWRKST